MSVHLPRTSSCLAHEPIDLVATGSASELAAHLYSILLPGTIWCHILKDELEEAEHQLEFLKEVQQSLGRSEVSPPGRMDCSRALSRCPPTPGLPLGFAARLCPG